MTEPLWGCHWKRMDEVVAYDLDEAIRVAKMYGPTLVELVEWTGTAEEHAVSAAAELRRRAEYKARSKGYRLDGTRLVANTDHPLRHPWPADCFVQGGDRGLVFRKGADPEFTAFVEACPRNPDTFLRGEGATVADAEDACWAQYQRVVTCTPTGGEPDGAPHGPYERRQYTNGSGYCVRCGCWFPRVLPEAPDDPDREPSLLERALTGDTGAAVEVLAHLTAPGAPEGTST